MSLEDYYQERKEGAYATILRQYLEKCKEVERLKEQIKELIHAGSLTSNSQS